jgi:transcriptional regulator with XRE-family HTH domain
MLIADIRLARQAKGWTQRTLAERAGVDVQTIKRLEKGVGSVPTLIAVMSALAYRLSGVGPGDTLLEQLRVRRQRQRLSIADVAARAGVARATVVALERGEGSIASLLKLMALIAPNARRRAPERSYWGAGDKADRDSRFTPPDFVAAIVDAFGEIDLDPCAHELSSVVARRRILPSEGGNGLIDDWSGSFAFVNPPYSELLIWLRRAHEQWQAGNVQTLACLVPVRTDSAWFHETLIADADIYLVRGRVRFLNPRGAAQPTPFSLMLVTLGASDGQMARCAEHIPGHWIAQSRRS